MQADREATRVESIRHALLGDAILTPRVRCALRDLDKLDAALRKIGLPTHVPEHFDALDYWKHTACKRGETARDALGVTAEELMREAVSATGSAE